MFDIGWTELLLIGIVALIVIGPKDLPAMFHTLGRFVARAKGMAREFQNAMNEAAREAGVEDIAKDLKKATSPRALGLDKLQEAATKFENWDPTIPSSDKTKNKPTPEQEAVGEKILKASAKAAGVSGDDAPAKGIAGKAGTKKAAVKKSSAKKPAGKKSAAKKPAAKKPVAKKPAAKKPSAKKPAAKAPVAVKPAPKKPVAVKPRAKKTATKSSGAKIKS